MKHFDTLTVDKCGRISIPANARKSLGIKPGDRLKVIYDEQSLTVRKNLTIEDVAGSFYPLPDGEGKDFKELIHIAKDEHFAKKYGRQRRRE